MPSVKVSELFKELSDWYDFYVLFHDYKLFGDLPEIFGRDEPLDLADMCHIHLARTAQIQARWSREERQFKRTTLITEPENDYWLIYAYDDVADEYLLLTITGPDAHNRREWGTYLRTILTEIVEPWILGRRTYPDID